MTLQGVLVLAGVGLCIRSARPYAFAALVADVALIFAAGSDLLIDLAVWLCPVRLREIRRAEWHGQLAELQSSWQVGALSFAAGTVIAGLKDRWNWAGLKLEDALIATRTFITTPGLDLVYESRNPYSENSAVVAPLFLMSIGVGFALAASCLAAGNHWLSTVVCSISGLCSLGLGAHVYNRRILARAHAVGLCNYRTISQISSLHPDDLPTIDRMIKEADALIGFLQGTRGWAGPTPNEATPPAS